MIAIIFFAAVIVGGVFILIMGLDEVRKQSWKDNLLGFLLEVILSPILGEPFSGMALILYGIVFTVIGVLGLTFGWFR